jgi:hypothetical protein
MAVELVNDGPVTLMVESLGAKGPKGAAQEPRGGAA